LKLYEGMFVLDPHLTEDALKSLISEIEEEVKKLKGEILKSHSLGKKRMAYAINKQNDSYYHVLIFKLEPSGIDTLNNKLKPKESIVRSLFLSRTEELITEAAVYLDETASRTVSESY